MMFNKQREKEEALKKVEMEMMLERQLAAKQKLEMQIEELKATMQVMKHLGDDDVQELINKMNGDLEAKMEEIGDIEEMNQALIVMERQRNDELQARKELNKTEKEEALKKIEMEMMLERQLAAKQKLEMEIEQLKGRLQVTKHLGDDDVREFINKMNDELEARMEEIGDLENMNQTLLINERQRIDARKDLIKVLQDMPRGRFNIGVKRMGEIDLKAFQDACYEKFDAEEAQIKASELCAL
ncbi:factor of DNA methylation 1-like protein isoform X1 [Tanacetum coccineum]|uniref:Factor of DNA methylation 1-like protein isoform X1 n=1 Tax=Tanacetum coccineum TaxID=301880 RepID=A0ABQ4YYX6_9ASTR